MTVAPALSARQVAAALGISYDLFIRTRAQLEARGFPRPLPLVSRGGRPGGSGEVGTGSPPGASGRKRGRPPLKWCADSVEDWKRDPRTPAQRQPANDIIAGAGGPRIRTRDRDLLRERLG